ncbi:DUF1488 domain-containing protein [Pararhizobium sp. BT-229]|uniref:DUF1488 domain-containing protein n=1 Tax=Pararhizobium sp. BT-229 TaxID=2986923 RepID=UPI0021F6D28E|nr:DUF1488 domain-containing protein [Pararhizobium sp. BT-229]MCV9965768.1 DUF1488 domain-containing protein [Pararhizobium sp. BT-229]
MTLSFPNNARSYDETQMRVRFTGYDGMFEIKCFVTADVLAKGVAVRAAAERDYLDAFDKMRPRILDVAKRVYNARRQAMVLLDLSNFR